MPSVTELGVNS